MCATKRKKHIRIKQKKTISRWKSVVLMLRIQSDIIDSIYKKFDDDDDGFNGIIITNIFFLNFHRHLFIK